MSDDLSRLLAEHRDVLERFVQSHAGLVLLRFETAEDLAQTVQLEALGAADRFELRSEEEFRAWLFTIARRCIQRRRKHWFALKRSCGPLVRLTGTGPEGDPTPLPLEARDTGPVTFADRRELLVLVAKALDLLSDRDRTLIEAAIAGLDRHQLADRLGLSVDAAERARLRAYERLRKTFRLLTRAQRGGTEGLQPED